MPTDDHLRDLLPLLLPKWHEDHHRPFGHPGMKLPLRPRQNIQGNRSPRG